MNSVIIWVRSSTAASPHRRNCCIFRKNVYNPSILKQKIPQIFYLKFICKTRIIYLFQFSKGPLKAHTYIVGYRFFYYRKEDHLRLYRILHLLFYFIYYFISIRTIRPSRVTRLRGFHHEAVLAKNFM